MHASEGSAALSPVDGELKQSHFLSVTHAATVSGSSCGPESTTVDDIHAPIRANPGKTLENFLDKCATRRQLLTADVFADLVKDDLANRKSRSYVFIAMFFKLPGSFLAD